MKGRLRLSMAWLHTWGGLLISWLLFAVLWSGTLAIFAPEITHWMQPERQQMATSADKIINADAALRYLRREAPDASAWFIDLPNPRAPVIQVAWTEVQTGMRHTRIVDARTTAGTTPRPSEGGEHFGHFHADLHSGTLGIWLVGLTGLLMLVAIISGVIIHKRIFKDFFTFRPRSSAQRSWLDGHNAGGVLLLPFHLMIAYTGLICHFAIFMPAAVNLYFGGDEDALRSEVVQRHAIKPANEPGVLKPVAPLLQRAETILGADSVHMMIVRNPGDLHASVQFYRDVDDRLALVADHATFNMVTGELLGSQTEWNPVARSFRAMVGLHMGLFGGWIMQWLYFLAGLVCSAMVASGLVLFSIKRRTKHASASRGQRNFYRAVERLNVVAVPGLIVASAGYFWANRLLPVAMSERASTEILVFFLLWALTAVHACARPTTAAWREQLAMAAILCMGLPALDMCTAGNALSLSVARKDFIPLAVDLTALAFGLMMAAIAYRLTAKPKARQRGATAPLRQAPTAGTPGILT